MTTPGGDFPDDAISSDDLSPLSGLEESEWRAGLSSRAVGGFNTGHFNLVGAIVGLVQGGIDLVVGVVTGVVDGVNTVISTIGGLFSDGHNDSIRVDQARVDAENAIADNMSESLEHLDEVLRFGGASMQYPTFRFEWGEDIAHVLPLSEPMNLAAGTRWIPPNWTPTHSSNELYINNSTNRRNMGAASGQLELMESGLWLIFFQAAVLQGQNRTDIPADVWCYVTNAGSWVLPVGEPGFKRDGSSSPGRMSVVQRNGSYESDVFSQSALETFGRAGSYLHFRDSKFGGGNTVFGMLPAYLDSGGYKVSMSCTAYQHFGGAMGTYVVAHKVNTETLRDSIDDLKDKISQDLPGQNVDMMLNEASIQAMVSQVDDIDVPPVEVPDE